MIIIDLIYNLALLVALSVVSGFIGQRWKLDVRGALLQGVIFGSAAVIGMLRPLVLAPGLIFDGRSVMISLCGLFFGPAAVTVAGVMALTCRILQGGMGAIMGVSVILSSALLGLLFHFRHVRRGVEISAIQLLGFGIIVHIAMVLLIFTLPWAIALITIERIGLPVLLIYPLATLFIGKILSDHQIREQSQAALRDSEARYRDLVENANSIILRMDTHGTITFFNEFAQSFFGFTLNEILGKNVVGTIVADDDGKGQAAILRDIGRHSEHFPVHESENIRKDGTRCWVAWTKKSIQNAQEQNTDILCIGSDVTESRYAAESLSNAVKETEFERERFRMLVNSAPFGMVLIGKDGEFILINPKFRELFGYDETNVPNGSEWFQKAFPDSEYRSKVIATWIADAKNMQQGERHRIFSVTCKNGEKKVISFIPVELTNGDQLMTMVDITRNIELEDRFHQTERLESVGRLAAGVAHDLNNLLSPILGYAELTLFDLDTTTRAYRRVQGIKQAAERARDLIRQLLAFGRKQILEMRVLDLRQVVGDMEKLIQRTIRENIKLETFLCPESCQVSADAGQIGQILMNLCVNAQDAMPDGGNLTIEVMHVYLDESGFGETAVKQGKYIMLAVSDTGCGMDKETQQHIFEPFFTTKKDMGTGLGLATVYGIVKQHDGNIWVYSEQKQGTTFKVYLPSVQAEISATERSFQSEEDLHGSETVLVVEDNEMACEVVGSILERLGYTVLSAANGNDALNLLKPYVGPVNLLLTDVVMPDMDGKTLFGKISQIRPDIRVLFMSGYTQDVIGHHGILDEGVYFIQKPFSIQALATKVREVVM
jgi:PAS domain S-box-containing protein